jgi:hypothetical protein
METDKLNEKDAVIEQSTAHITPSPYTEGRKASIVPEKLIDDDGKLVPIIKKKKNIGQSVANFIYNPRKKTVLGRTALNWGKKNCKLN